jgi:hypothetical protein
MTYVRNRSTSDVPDLFSSVIPAKAGMTMT